MEIIRSPNSTIVGQWTPVPYGYPNYATVSSYPTPEDSSYNGAYCGYIDSPYYDKFTVPAITTTDLPTGITISSVAIHVRARASISYWNTKLFLLIGAGSAYYNGDIGHIYAGFLDYAYSWMTNPATGVAWTRDDLLGLSEAHLLGIGYQVNNAIPTADYIYISQCYLRVTFETSTSGTLKKWSGAIERKLFGSRGIAGSLTITSTLLLVRKEIRAMYVMGDYLYVLVGNALYKVDKNWSKTLLGNIGTSSGKAWIHGDGTNLAVVDGTKGYSWDGATFAEITFPDAFTPSCLSYQDGYYIVGKDGTGRFYISALLDPTSWEALDYATAEGFHDNLITIQSYDRNLWLMGSESLEIWFNSGASSFPFERCQGGFIKVGCKAARSAVATDQGLFWLDNNLQVRRGVGVQSEIVSTPQIEYWIGEFGKLIKWEDVTAFSYTQKGHSFYVLNLGIYKTFALDLSTGIWHSRASGESNRRHPTQCYALFNNKHLVGHYSRGRIYSLEFGTYTNDGECFYAIRTAQAIKAGRKRVFHRQVEIEFETGVGSSTTVAANATLEWSDDFGRTWSTPRTVSIGKYGEYNIRAIWRRLGHSRKRIYRVTINDPVKRLIIGAHFDLEEGMD